MESISRTEGITHTSGVPSGIILYDLVSIVSSMLYGLSIIGTWTCFPLPRAGMPLSDVDPTDATHVSLSILFGIFSFFNLFVECTGA